MPRRPYQPKDHYFKKAKDLWVYRGGYMSRYIPVPERLARGIEDGLASLAGHVSRSDLVVFPVDCVSHSAVGIIRKLCRDGARDCIPLRTASVASFLDALQRHAA